jgi:hypothetical protein
MVRAARFDRLPGIFDLGRNLWHAVQRFRQRQVRRRALKLIRASGLFDEAWYLAENPDVAQSGIDPARHYLLHGWLEGRNPSPLFDGQEYLSRHPELFAARVNPLVHHLQLDWRQEQVRPLTRPQEAADPATIPAAPVALPDLPPSWRHGSLDRGVEGKTPCTVGDTVLGYGLPGSAAIDALDRQVRCLVRLGVREAPALGVAGNRAEDAAARRGGPVRDEAVTASEILQWQAAAAPRFDDAWFVSSHCLRVRWAAGANDREPCIATALQWAIAGGAPVMSEAVIGDPGLFFLDVQLANPFLPVLLVLTTPTGDVRASTLLPFPSLCRGGLHHGETLCGATGAGGIDAIRLTSARLLSGWSSAGRAASLDWIEVDLSDANGAERLFAADLLEWMGELLGIGIRPCDDAPRADHPGAAWLHQMVPRSARRGSAAARIVRLTADAVPALHALFGMVDPTAGPAPVILCHGGDGTPAWILDPPAAGHALEEFQPGLVGPFPRLTGPARSGVAPAEARGPAAIRVPRRTRRSPAELQAPFAPETPMERILPGLFATTAPSPRVTVVLAHGGDEGLAAARLEALSLQVDVAWDRVVLMADAADGPAATSAMQRHFPSCGEVVVHAEDTPPHARFNQAAARAHGEALLVLGGDVLLHDRRTVAALVRMLASPRVASAGCMLIAAGTGIKAEHMDVLACGCHGSTPVPNHANFSHLRLVDALVSLPPATWPVRANASALFLVRPPDWIALGGFERGPTESEPLATGYWDAAAKTGRLHLSTTAFSATVLRAGGVGALPPDGPTDISPSALTARRIVA